MSRFQEILNSISETLASKPGLWDNIRQKKRKRRQEI